jgi:small-conductance mechanosensitive channel
VARSLAGFFRRIETGAIDVPWLEADIAPPTRRIVIAALWVFALVMAYPYIPGSKSEAFKGISVLVGLMLSLGATGAVGQAACGMMLFYSRTLRSGEWVRIGEHEAEASGCSRRASGPASATRSSSRTRSSSE